MAEWMGLAIEQAKQAAAKGEVPVGAVLVDEQDNLPLAIAHNQMRRQNSPLAHAEMLVLRQGASFKQGKLSRCSLYVTLEPCPMCAQAISFARLKALYFGAYDPKGGGVEHGPRIFESTSCFHKPLYWGGIQERLCQQLLKDFFKHLR